MVKQLAMCVLQKGVGSMGYIHSMMIVMYDGNEDEVLPVQQNMQEASSPSNSNERQEPVPDWCRCGNCFIMPQAIGNKCCKHKKCVTNTRRFRKLCLDPEFLLLSQNVGDIRNDPHDNSTRAFRKQAYQHILDTYGYLGKGNRKVAPSCVVIYIRKHYPSPTGVYSYFN
jgi:hypothetical protein